MPSATPPRISRKPRVLIVDAEPDILWSLSLLLEPLYEVTMAANAEAGLLALDEGPFDVVLLDLAMPPTDGAAFTRELERRGVHAPVVHLTKPIDIPKLEATLARVTG